MNRNDPQTHIEAQALADGKAALERRWWASYCGHSRRTLAPNAVAFTMRGRVVTTGATVRIEIMVVNDVIRVPREVPGTARRQSASRRVPRDQVEDVVQTSATHPIEVGWAAHGRYRIGLTFAPGKCGPSLTGAHRWERDLDTDLVRLKRDFGVATLACLIEDHELDGLRIGDLFARAEAHGIDVWRLPIPDGGVPADAAQARLLIQVLAHAVRQNAGAVVIHCRGGLGRTGTIAACLLVELGATPGDALIAVARARGPRCPESPAQIAYVNAYTPTSEAHHAPC